MTAVTIFFSLFICCTYPEFILNCAVFLGLLVGLSLLSIHTLFTSNCTLPSKIFRSLKKHNKYWLAKTESTYLFVNRIGRLYYLSINSSFPPSDWQDLFIVYFIRNKQQNKTKWNKQTNKNRNFNQIKSGDQKGEFSQSAMIAEPNREKILLS